MKTLLHTLKRLAGSIALLAMLLFSSLTARGQVTITTASLPVGAVGVQYLNTLAATSSNSSPSFVWTITSGSLPDGIKLVTNGGTGLIAGTPRQAGTFTFTVQVTDGSLSASQTLSLTVNSSKTYDNLMAAVQGETNANAKYLAFAAKARQEGYFEVANLFTATATAEALHAASEWALLVKMGATAAEKPMADTPTVGTTAENLQAAINGETYEYTTMYLGFAADATAEGNADAASLFTRTGKVENIHANNYTDALLNLYDGAYLNATFSTVYLCPVCGAIFNVATLPATGRCTVCNTSSGLFVQYKTSRTYADLMAAVQGETNANAHYLAFAAKARQEGYHEVANLFTATATAEALHAASEWALLVKMGATAAEKPVADTPIVGTTAENLQAAINGETYEYTVMYPGFAADATAEGNADAASLFTRTGKVENIHANNYTDALLNLYDGAYLNATFSTVYLCPVCGAIFNVATLPATGRCTVCNTSSGLFVQYKMIATNTVTVVSGTGSGSFSEGDYVPVSADAAPAGKVFDKWTTADGVTFTDVANPYTGFFMPANAVTITANYKVITYAPTITTASLPGGMVGTAYNQTLQATGDAPIIWSVSAGSLPGGLRFAEATGAILGTPTVSGNFSFTVTATNATGSDSKTLSIVIAAAPTYVISASTLTPFGSLQSPYVQPAAQTVTVTNTGTGSVTMAEPTATYYDVSNLSTLNLAPGATATFTVQPKADLTVGNYDEMLTVNGSNGARATIDASFIVTVTTGTGSVGQPTGLKAWVEKGTLHISGLTAGKQWNVYTASGTLIHQGIATGDEATQSIASRGVYIVQSETGTIKVVY